MWSIRVDWLLNYYGINGDVMAKNERAEREWSPKSDSVQKTVYVLQGNPLWLTLSIQSVPDCASSSVF